MSTMTSKVFSKFGSLRTGSLAKIYLTLLKAWSSSSDQVDASSFLVSRVRGSVMKAYSLTNILHHPTSPKNPQTSKTLQGIGQLTMASTLAGSGEIPFLEMINPR